MPGQGVLLVLLAAGFASASNVLSKWSLPRLPFDRFLAARSLGAAVTLALLSAATGAPGIAGWRLLALLVLSGFIWPGVVNPLVYHAMKRLPVNISRAVFQSYPAMAYMGSLLLGDAEVALKPLAGMALALGGAAAFGYFVPAAGPSQRIWRRDVGLTVSAALLQAGGTLLWRWLVSSRQVSAVSLNLAQNAGTLLLFGGVMTAVDEKCARERRVRPAGWLPFLVSAAAGALIFGFGNSCFMASLGYQYMNPGIAGSIYTLNVLLTGGLARVFLGECWSRQQFAAALAVMAGAVVLSLTC